MAGDRLTFTPRWQGEIEGYAKKWVRAHHWRVRCICNDPEDSLSECMVVFAKCVRLYRGKVDNPRWFMALYKKALARYWIDLARHSQRLAQGDAAACEMAAEAPQSEAPAADLVVALGEIARTLPQRLRLSGEPPAVLAWLLTDPPPPSLPQCGRVAHRGLARDLWPRAA